MSLSKKLAYLSLAVAFLCFSTAGQTPPNTALVNGKWFDGKEFKARTVYSVDSRFTAKKPARIDKTVDLTGLFVIPPLADAHNHSIATGVDEWDRRAIARFLADGVFYVKIMGNLPISEEGKRALPLNRPDGLDVVFGQGSITGSGGHPIGLIENVLMSRGYFPGFTKERLRDYRYFIVDSEAELEQKWPAILRLRPDHIKTLLWSSDEYEKRKNDPAFYGQRALDPSLLPKIVAKAHASGLRVSTHVTTAADFKIAVAAGVDEIAHLPYLGSDTIEVADAKLAAERKIVVNTTASLLKRLPKNALPDAERPGVEKAQIANLKLLFENNVRLAIGSDDTGDTSINEALYLSGLGVFDTATLLRIWTEATPLSIFPDRKIGRFEDGYEASFIALDADPLADLSNVKRIKYLFKQGALFDVPSQK
jgi:imidazolonepropionase-like amidohydrolase